MEHNYLESLYNSPAMIRDLLKMRGLKMTKQFGQNFLIDEHARRMIIEALMLKEQMSVWEIGPGIGAMTHMALQRGVGMTAFEIDHGFCDLLRDLLGEYPGFSLVEGDVLKTWGEASRRLPMPDRLFGNLPYNIGSVAIARLIEGEFLPEVMVFTLQREVALRLGEQPGSKLYASFTLLCSLDYEVERTRDIGRESFYPSPEVVSTVVTFRRRKEPRVQGLQRRIYLGLIRELFASRRKTIRNNLKQGALRQYYDLEELLGVFSALGIGESRRGETIGREDMLEAARLIGELPRNQ